MAKVQFSDVVPPDRRSIRDVPIPQSGKRKSPVVIKPSASLSPKPDLAPVSKPEATLVSSKIAEIADIKDNKAYEYYYPKDKVEPKQPAQVNYQKSSGKRFFFGGIILIAIVGFVLAMMTVFASANVLVTPKSQALEVLMDLVATTETDPNSVRYEVVKFSESQTVSVPAAGEESVKQTAQGKIVIYNNFSSETQRLIVRTRFESPEGFIYRIPESVIVPGKSTKDGVETPGSVEVEVFADEPGEKYNIKKTDFTIPGFKNDAGRYKNFYARSVTEMSGGFVGNRKAVLPADKEVALQKLDSEIQTLLEKQIRSKIPAGLTLLSNSIVYESRELPQVDESSAVIIGKEVVAYAMLLNSRDLSDKVITKYISNYPDWENITSSIQDFTSLSITKKPDKSAFGQKIDLEINGKAKILAEIDTNLVSQRLAGMSKKQVTTVIKEFSGIKSVSVAIKPVWKQSFPENPLKINVKMGAGL